MPDDVVVQASIKDGVEARSLPSAHAPLASTRPLSTAAPRTALVAVLDGRHRQPIAGRGRRWPRPADQLRDPRCLLTAAALRPVPGSAWGVG